MSSNGRYFGSSVMFASVIAVLWSAATAQDNQDKGLPAPRLSRLALDWLASLDGALGRVELAGIGRPPAQQGEVLRAVVLAAPGDLQVAVRLSSSTARRSQT